MMSRRQFALAATAAATLSGRAAAIPPGPPGLLHVAWFRFKDGVTGDRIEQHFAACRALAGVVPVVHDLQCGPNLTDRADGMTHGIVVTLRDRKAIQAYLDHPAHVPVAAALKEDVAALRVMDIEIRRG
jgi:Stress responsive A/B Barrel Domain